MSRSITGAVGLAVSLLSVMRVAGSAPLDANWAQWRGPGGLGISPGTAYAGEWSPVNPIGEPVYASLALAGGTIYIRGERHLFAIRPPANAGR